MLSPPWWQIIPLDFITDVVIPMTITDRLSISHTLNPASVAPEEKDAVLERADELRKKAFSPPPKE